MASGISFGGSIIKRPGAYSVVDTAGMTPISLGALRILAFVGTVGEDTNSLLLPADTVTYFNDPSVAKSALGSCDMLDCMNIAWKYGADLIAVSPIWVDAPTDDQWQDALDLLDNEFIDGIVPITSEGAIQAKVLTHVKSASSIINRKRRRAFFGHATETAIADIITQAENLQEGGAERAVLATPCMYIMDNGEKVLKPSYYLASAYAGLWAGQEPQEPITYKFVNEGFVGVETIYSQADIESLLDAGIAPVEHIRNRGYRIVQGITLASAETGVAVDLTERELSVSTLKDVMSETIETYFEDKYVGQAGVDGIEVTMLNDLFSLLEGFKDANWIRDYVKESVRIVRDGTAFRPEWEGKPVLPINNFFITSHFTL